MNFADQLCIAIGEKQTPLIVGLDPRISHLPNSFRSNSNSPLAIAHSIRDFCCAVIDIVATRVPMIKPNAAFFEALGPAGMEVLAGVNRYASSRGLLVLLDAKRGDIGTTATAYAEAYLTQGNPWSSDALTVNPFLGNDTLVPMLDLARTNGRGIFVLVKTSNPGSDCYQELTIDGISISDRVANVVEMHSVETVGHHGYGICGAVVGATYPEQIEKLRGLMPHSIFLIPGVGAQGATAEDIKNAFDERGFGAIVNSSRGIIFAHQRDEFGHLAWERAVEAATNQLVEELASFTSAGKLRGL